MNKLQNIKTFFKEFKYLKRYFFQELNKMTFERLMVEHLSKYSAPLIKEHEYDPKSLEKYIDLCEKRIIPKTPSPIDKTLYKIPENMVKGIVLDDEGKLKVEFK